MKQCPACEEIYDGTQNFCEADGSRLSDDAEVLRATLRRATAAKMDHDSSKEKWIVGLIGVVVGVVVAMSLFFVQLVSVQNSDPAAGERKMLSTSEAPPPPSAPARAAQRETTLAPEPSPTPNEEEATAEEEEEMAEAQPPPAAPAAASQPAAARLNQGPVSTGRGTQEDVQTVIRLEDGSVIEVDAAWEDSQGIWYRRSGLVSLVARNRVVAITQREAPELSPAPTP